MKRFLSLIALCCLFAVGSVTSGCEFVGPEMSTAEVTNDTGGACHNIDDDCPKGAEHNTGD